MSINPTGGPGECQRIPHASLTVSMPQELLDQVAIIAADERITVSHLVRECLAQYIKLHRHTQEYQLLVDKMNIDDLISLANHHHIDIAPEEGIDDLKRKLSEMIVSE